MKVKHVIYEDGVIAVAMIASDESKAAHNHYHVGMRWLALEPRTTNIMGGKTDWFLLPHTLGVGVARALIERKAAEPKDFDTANFSRMMTWLVELEEVFDGMCY